MKKLDKKSISPADQFLANFDQNHEKSASQKAEIAKYQKIHQKRDDATLKDDQIEDSLWD